MTILYIHEVEYTPTRSVKIYFRLRELKINMNQYYIVFKICLHFKQSQENVKNPQKTEDTHSLSIV